ncbi:hypothetical protein BC832DRAFT_267036 [Gaertneriomyces semiglobifer]|nr:hypothetical protein BC832DRAFT_267036 [Gaertneriomyces semiglobifer]
MTDDGRMLFILVTGDDGSTVLLQCEHPYLFAEQKTLKSLSRLLGKIDYLASYVALYIDILARECEIVTNTTKQQTKAFHNIAEDHNVSTSFGFELLNMLLLGLPSETFEQYIAQRLRTTQQGLKPWQKTVDSAQANIEKIIDAQVFPALEQLMRCLMSLQALTEW